MKKEEHFNTSEKRKPAQRQPMQLGLYDATNEHDACGVGMLVNIHGSKSHELVESALKVLENMRHRGAEGADNKTGDGAGIMLQIPHEFILLQLTAGLVAIFSLRELSQRSQLFRTAILVILTYAAVYFAFELITENDLSKLNGSMYTYFVINGVLLLFTYPLLFLVENPSASLRMLLWWNCPISTTVCCGACRKPYPAHSSIPCR